MPLIVTFDTNTFDKVSRPTFYPKDPGHPEMVEVHDAVKRGDIQGFMCDVLLTLEGITRKDRATVFGGTIVRSSMRQTSEDTFSITVTPEQPDRRPVHLKQAERFSAACALGFRLLMGPPYVGIPRVEEEFYTLEDREGVFAPSKKMLASPLVGTPMAAEEFRAIEDTPYRAFLLQRLDRQVRLAKEIEKRGVGCGRAKALAARLAGGALRGSIWWQSLGNVQDVHERGEVSRAIAEWADGDSVAAHYGYGNDFFCTLDAGKGESKRGDPAILDADNRAWLTEKYGIQFVTIGELAKAI
jgi:hypothetical protein